MENLISTLLSYRHNPIEFRKSLEIVKISFLNLPFDEQIKILDLLENYECWAVFSYLVNLYIAKSSLDSYCLELYVRLAKVQSIYLDDIFAVSETCAQVIQKFNLDYENFRTKILSIIIEKENYIKEVSLLRTVQDVFPSLKDKIAVIERICFIFEKKLHNEEELYQYYNKLIQLDPTNKKALNYFKLLYIQNNNWEQVINILKIMLENEKNINTIHNIAQELGYVYLFQLDKPKECITILDKYCEDSHLDLSSLYFEAYYRLKDWQGCLSVLRKVLIEFNHDIPTRAKIHFKMGVIKELQKEYEEAILEYKKAISLDSNLYDPYENLATLYVQLKKWEDIIWLIEELKSKAEDAQLIEKLNHVKERLVSGIKHEQK